MKSGRFFPIPETPGDIEQLRHQAAPLDLHTRPAWLQECDIDFYRHVVGRSVAGLDDDERQQLAKEISELERTGLLVVDDCNEADLKHVYIRTASDYDVWSIGIYAGTSPLQLGPAAGAPSPVLARKDISDVAAMLVADPFMIRHQATWFMFFEILNWETNKGEIGMATSDDGLQWNYRQRVLIEPFHLSYPYVFQHQDVYYMIPESRQARSVRLYRAVEFPTRWCFTKTLLDDVDLTDSSIVRRDGRWWMLAGADSTTGRHDRLRLFSADALTGRWREHPSSPIVDGNSHMARPAGRLVIVGGQLLRFAQNCHPVYGRDVRAFGVTELTTETYRETQICANPILGPSAVGWNACGMHHLDAHQLDDGSWLACVDGWTNSIPM